MNDNKAINEGVRRLEERLTALERHIFEQDREILALARQIEHLRDGVRGLRERLSESGSGNDGRLDDSEHPPHY